MIPRRNLNEILEIPRKSLKLTESTAQLSLKEAFNQTPGKKKRRGIKYDFTV